MKVKKVIIMVFEYNELEKTGLQKDIPATLEFDSTDSRDEKTMQAIKDSLKLFKCVIVTTKKTLLESTNLINQVRKMSKLKKIYLREIKITP